MTSLFKRQESIRRYLTKTAQLRGERRLIKHMDLLSTEIHFDIVKYHDNREVNQLSRPSRRMRDVCLPSLLRKQFVPEKLHSCFNILEGICPLGSFILRNSFPPVIYSGKSSFLRARGPNGDVRSMAFVCIKRKTDFVYVSAFRARTKAITSHIAMPDRYITALADLR